MNLRASVAAATARRDVRLLGVVVAAELALLGIYVLATPGDVTTPRYALYPFVWINAGIWAVFHTDVPSATRIQQVAAGLVAVVYLFVLLWFAGLVGIDPAGNPADIVGLTIGYGSPGWERVRLVLPGAYLTLIPYRVIGYLTLSFLVFVTLLDATEAALSGAIGLLSCISCSFPILASLSTGLFGGSAALATNVLAYSVDVSTAVFLLALALLYYRPGFGSRIGQRME
jgi:hypothetical protein